MRIYCKRLPLLGSLVVLLINSSVAQNLSFTSQFCDLLVQKPICLLNLPNKSNFSADYSYSPLLIEKGETRDDTFNSTIYNHTVNASVYISKTAYKAYLKCSYKDFFAAYRKDSISYSTEISNRTITFESGLSFISQSCTIGVGLGRHNPLTMKRERLDDIKVKGSDYVKSGPWQFQTNCKIPFFTGTLAFNLFSGPIYSSVISIVTNKTNSFRTFPLSIKKSSISGSYAIQESNIFSQTSLSFAHLRQLDLQSTQNSMPSTISINNYTLTTNGIRRISQIDSLTWSISGNVYGGWIANYNFSRDQTKVLECDQIKIRNMHLSVDKTVAHHFTLSTYESFTYINAPDGYLRLSPFSSWTIFRPIDFKYRMGKMKTFESDISINRRFTFSKFNLKPALTFLYCYNHLSVDISQKKIVVLIPIYSSEKHEEPINNHLFAGSVHIPCTYTSGRNTIHFSYLQNIPIKSVNRSNEKDKTSEDNSGIDSKGSYSGGLRFYAGLTRDF
jgi:hypothetical protein